MANISEVIHQSIRIDIRMLNLKIFLRVKVIAMKIKLKTAFDGITIVFIFLLVSQNCVILVETYRVCVEFRALSIDVLEGGGKG